MPSRKERAETSDRNKPLAKDRVVYQMTMPKSHLHILETEADLWGVGRGEFLTMLLRRKFGDLAFERPKNAPSYHPTEDELIETERYAWYLPSRDAPKLEADRLKMGNIAVSTWACLLLNNWIGLPTGQPGEPEVIRRIFIDRMNEIIPEDSPAEPYWGIYEVDASGRVTGNLWSIGPKEICLFLERKQAEIILPILPPPSGRPSLLGQRGVAWAIRGLSKSGLKILQSNPETKLFVGSISQDGELVARQIT
jgi:hypothetical protein